MSSIVIKKNEWIPYIQEFLGSMPLVQNPLSRYINKSNTCYLLGRKGII